MKPKQKKIQWVSLPCVLIWVLFFVVFTSVSASETHSEKMLFDLKEGPAAEVLEQLGMMVGSPVIYRADQIKEIRFQALNQRLSLEEALSILCSDTPLEMKIDEGTGAIVVSSSNMGFVSSDVGEGEAVDRLGARFGTGGVQSGKKSIFEKLVDAFSFGIGDEPSQRVAHPFDEERFIELETYIVTGTRSSNRTVVHSIHPIDVLPNSDLEWSISGDLSENLVSYIPSFNVQRLPMSDGQVFVRPARLRGLSPDHTLVMLNGKRFHRSPMLFDSGAQSPDLSQIPENAVSHIEVLRDGASAQYGSDAIAGSINLLLNSDVGSSGFYQFSEFYEGDGKEEQIGINVGWNLNQDGFLGLSALQIDSELTSRSRQRADAIDYQQAHPELDVPNPVQRWGRPEHQALQLSFNSYCPFSTEIEGYAFAILSESEGYTDFNWRSPTASYFGPTAVFPGWTLTDVYPVGFSPWFWQENQDYQAYAGIRDVMGDFQWDVSAGRGRGDIHYHMSNSYNISMGPESPTCFDIGHLMQSETAYNADFRWLWESGFSENPIHVSFGAEERQETYQIVAGEESSYLIGPGASEGLPVGSNGYPGLSDLQAGKWSQKSRAFYTDVEWNPIPRWNVEFATRWEDYDSFGSHSDLKLASRFELNDRLAIRGGWSTGFRAPTPAQIYSTEINQGLDTDTLIVFTQGRLSPLNPVSQRFGAEALEPETATNYSAGLVWSNLEHTVISIDCYRINVNNRFGSSSTFEVTDSIKVQLSREGIIGAELFNTVYFFTNDYETHTEGYDVTVSHLMDLFDSQFKITFAYNYNRTGYESGSITSDPDEVFKFENYLPRSAGNVSFNYRKGRMETMLRLRYFGKWMDYADESSGEKFQEFGAACFVDLSVRYLFENCLELRIGAENLFDGYPDEATFQANRGLIYSRNAPYSTDGGRYYLRADYRF